MPGALMFPLMLVTTAVVASIVAWSLPPTRRLPLARELALLVALFFTYFWLRGVTEGGELEALAHGRQLEDLERALGVFWEPDLQAHALNRDRLIEAGNLIYIWAHWPVLGAVAIWLYREHLPRYARYRNAIVISGAIGVVIFALYPAAPPRFASPDIIGTIDQRAEYYENFQPSFLSNQFAAVPSLHVGWSVLMGIALIRESRRRWVQAIGVAMPLVMTWAVVVTGNHYFIDGVIGTALSVGGLVIASGAVRPAWTGWRRPLRSPAKRHGGETAHFSSVGDPPTDRPSYERRE